MILNYIWEIKYIRNFLFLGIAHLVTHLSDILPRFLCFRIKQSSQLMVFPLSFSPLVPSSFISIFYSCVFIMFFFFSFLISIFFSFFKMKNTFGLSPSSFVICHKKTKTKEKRFLVLRISFHTRKKK